MLCRTLAPPCRACRPAQRPVFRPSPRSRRSMVVAARITVEPFNGCNCFYLLSKAKKGDSAGNTLVLSSLDQIKEVNLNVVRTWAFQDDARSNGPSNALQYMDMATKKIVYNQDMLDGLKWMLDEAQKRKLKLMLTLTNGNPPEYGGMRQYVRWSQTLRELPDGTLDSHQLPNSAFFDDQQAQQLYQNFLSFIITKFKDHPAVHSWDIANEPRCSGDESGTKLSRWIDQTAAFVKTLDRVHPVTCGLDGYFGGSTPELSYGDTYNPYWNSAKDDGCDFVANCKSPNLDFACIHLYPSNWNIQPESNRATWALKWIHNHIDVIKNPKYGMNNIPLVLQEFNLDPNGAQRTQMFQDICSLLVKEVRSKGVFVGSMVWCLAAPDFSQYDSEKYYLYAPSAVQEAAQKDPQKRVQPELNNNQIAVLKYCSGQISKPASS